MLKAADTHARVDWPTVLLFLGVPTTFLRLKKAGPCPFCGGADRWTFDNRRGRGDYFCRRCGAGDGFSLLQRFLKEDFATVRKRVLQVAGLASKSGGVTKGCTASQNHHKRREAKSERAKPTGRVLDLLRSSCSVEDCADARAYLESRGIWPLPVTCGLRAHPSVEYFEEGRRVGRYATLLAPVCDIKGEFVSLHVTYLHEGRKLQGHEARKLLSKTTDREGCSVRLLPLEGDVLGVAEGIETALSAARVHDIPAWAALTTSLLAKFEPPRSVRRVVVYADRDVPGLEAAAKLMERLQGRVRLEMRLPPGSAKDWNDVIMRGRE